jgi:thioredoxin reductase (NADPH)
MSIKQINALEFENLTKTIKGLYIVDFYADWCGPCQRMIPVYQELSQDPNLKDFTFIKINRDENRELIAKYGFEIPTIPRFFAVKFTGDGVFTPQNNILINLGGSQGGDEIKQKLFTLIDTTNLKHNITIQNNSTQNMSENKKIAIIGSGPSGLTAAIYTSRANLDTKVYLGIQPGGQLTTTTEIENFPGAWSNETKAGMMGPDLMSLVQQQAEHFGAKTELAEVRSIEIDEKAEHKFILDSGLKKESFDAIIVASGASAKYLGLPGEEAFVGKGYHSCATCDGFFYRGKTIAVIGGGDSAMEEANFLTKFADKVYLIHRREEFKASKIMLERAQNNSKIEFILNKKINAFIGDDMVEGIVMEDTKTSEIKELKLDGVFVAIGHIPNTGFVKGKLNMDETGYLIPQSQRPQEERTSKYLTMSNIEGIFIAGDVEDKLYRQAITAAGEGCKAAMEAEKWLED